MLPQGRGTRAGPGSGGADRTGALSCESRALTAGPPRDSHGRLLSTPGGQCWPPLPTAQEHPSGPALVPGARSGTWGLHFRETTDLAAGQDRGPGCPSTRV